MSVGHFETNKQTILTDKVSILNGTRFFDEETTWESENQVLFIFIFIFPHNG